MGRRYAFALSLVVAHFSSWPVAAESANLIRNSSFEAGIDYGLAMGRWYVDGLPSARLDEKTKVHGRYSLRIPLSRTAYNTDGTRGLALRSALPIEVEAGVRYRFTVYLKSDAAIRGSLVVTPNNAFTWKFKDLGSRKILVGPQWKRAGLTFVAKEAGEVFWEIRLNSKRPATLWVDALWMGVNEDVVYAPAAPVEAALSSERLGHIFAPDEPTELILMAYNDGPSEVADYPFVIRVFDVEGTLVREVGISRTLPARGGIRLPVRLPRGRRGIFRAVLFAGGKKTLASEIHFSVLPQPRDVRSEDSAFGAYGTLAPEPLDLLRRLGFHWIANLTSNGRVIYWNMVEPKEGKFRWYDADLALAEARGFRLMFNLEPCRVPGWAAKLPREQLISKWAAYVRAMVTHYKDRVKYWTIGDEVQSTGKTKRYVCWADAPEYARWHEAGYRAIKSVDPDSKVILNTGHQFAGETLRHLPARMVDILADNRFHAPGGALAATRRIADERKIKEMWAPGVGVWSFSFYRIHMAQRRRTAPERYWRDKNHDLTTATIKTFAMGFRRLFQYSATYVGNTNNFSLFEADSTPRPIGAQFAALAWLLDGFSEACEVETDMLEKRFRVFRFDRNDGRTVFAFWGPPAEKQWARLKGVGKDRLRLYDHFTNELVITSDRDDIALPFGRDPVFLSAPSERAGALERAFRSPILLLDTLPEGKRREVAGRYAVVWAIKDALHGPKSGASYWYRSDELGWIEFGRERVSSIAPLIEATPAGIRMTWEVPLGTGNFFVEVGRLPPDLVAGAIFWRSRPAAGDRQEWRTGRIDLARLATPAADAPLPSGLSLSGGLDFLVAFNNGLTFTVVTNVLGSDGRPALAGHSPGGWRLLIRPLSKGDKTTGGDIFLHEYYGRARVPARIVSVISVR